MASQPDPATMPIVEHLTELRRRIIVCGAAVLTAFCLAYAFSKPLLRILLAPIDEALPAGSKLAILKVQEAFVTKLKVALVAALVAAFPVIIHQVWGFVLPALKKTEVKLAAVLILSSSILFAAGITFAYFAVLPYAFSFFLANAQGLASPTLSLGFYIGFCARMLLAFGAVFQMPLVIVFLVRTGLVPLAKVRSARKYAIVIIFSVAAILTPPDVFTQILMAVPLVALYEISILAAALFAKRA